MPTAALLSLVLNATAACAARTPSSPSLEVLSVVTRSQCNLAVNLALSLTKSSPSLPCLHAYSPDPHAMSCAAGKAAAGMQYVLKPLQTADDAVVHDAVFGTADFRKVVSCLSCRRPPPLTAPCRLSSSWPSSWSA